MSQTKTPIIALIGQTNTGKSSLFNRLVGYRRNIVAYEAGTTRDSIGELIELAPDKSAWLVDTAGLKTATDDFELTIQEQIETAVETADIICLVVEAQGQLDTTDRSLAKTALKSQKTVGLIANKIDLNQTARTDDFKQLGIKNIFLTSATTSAGIKALVAGLAELLPVKKMPKEESKITVALLGRPNAGKSALFNSLVKKQQALVAERAGTTRDINRMQIRFNQQVIELLDTAGLRRAGKVERGVEKFSVLRTLATLKASDISLLLIDVNELTTSMEQKIAGLVKDAGCGLILIISKWDTVDKDAKTADYVLAQLKEDFKFVPWCSVVFTSAVTGQNVSKIFELVLAIANRRQQTITTSKLNNYLQTAIQKHPPAGKYQPKLNYVTQTDTAPPTFCFFGRHVDQLHFSYKRFLETELRSQFDLQGTAINLIFREKS